MKIAAYAVIACVVLSGTQALAETGYLTKNDIAYCEENYEQYKLLGSYQFLEREQRTMEARVCVHLYGDPIWDYSGSDRLQKLLERGNYYVNVEIEQSKANAKTGIIPQEKQATAQNAGVKIFELEKKIAQKDAIIAEQIKVIMGLASKLKSILFEGRIPLFDIF
ncbi:MAG: hypothetical protein WAO91_08025 [Candidatus Nitrosotenuis sp.]